MGFIMSQTVLNKCKYSDRNKEGELEVTEKVFQRKVYGLKIWSTAKELCDSVYHASTLRKSLYAIAIYPICFKLRNRADKKEQSVSNAF